MNTTTLDDPWIDEAQVSLMTRLSRSFFQKRRGGGRTKDDGPPYYKVHGRVVYRRSEVVRWYERQMRVFLGGQLEEAGDDEGCWLDRTLLTPDVVATYWREVK